MKARDAAFGFGDTEPLRAARKDLTAGIKRAKEAHAQKIQGHSSTNNLKDMWKGNKCITEALQHQNHHNIRRSALQCDLSKSEGNPAKD